MTNSLSPAEDFEGNENTCFESYPVRSIKPRDEANRKSTSRWKKIDTGAKCENVNIISCRLDGLKMRKLERDRCKVV